MLLSIVVIMTILGSVIFGLNSIIMWPTGFSTE